MPSARLIANFVLGIHTSYVYNGMYGYTIQLNSSEAVASCKLKALETGGIILKDDYVKNNAIAIALPKGTSPSDLCEGTLKIVPGYPMPDNEGVFEYVNPEHPPLGKYIIALSMYVLGDYPTAWRIPGVIEAGFIVLIAGLIGWKLSGAFGSILASLAASLDPLTKNMGSVAMLDIHLAFFTALGLLFYVYNRPLLSALFISLSGLVKYSGFFLLPFIMLYISREKRDFFGAILYPSLFSLLLAIIAFLPLAYHYSIGWVFMQIRSALAWHMESRPPGPPTSTPIEWILGYSPFYLSYNPDISASGSPIIYVPVFVVSLIAPFLYLVEKERPGYELKSYGVMFSIDIFLLMYCILYAIGNRTLYSFYFTQIVPAFYASFPQSILILSDRYKSFEELGGIIKNFFLGYRRKNQLGGNSA
ncbi:MAG: glycosyltransferase family 39 protein [Fervidicoccaceae archaeon]